MIGFCSLSLSCRLVHFMFCAQLRILTTMKTRSRGGANENSRALSKQTAQWFEMHFSLFFFSCNYIKHDEICYYLYVCVCTT